MPRTPHYISISIFSRNFLKLSMIKKLPIKNLSSPSPFFFQKFLLPSYSEWKRIYRWEIRFEILGEKGKTWNPQNKSINSNFQGPKNNYLLTRIPPKNPSKLWGCRERTAWIQPNRPCGWRGLHSHKSRTRLKVWNRSVVWIKLMEDKNAKTVARFIV